MRLTPFLQLLISLEGANREKFLDQFRRRLAKKWNQAIPSIQPDDEPEHVPTKAWWDINSVFVVIRCPQGARPHVDGVVTLEKVDNLWADEERKEPLEDLPDPFVKDSVGNVILCTTRGEARRVALTERGEENGADSSHDCYIAQLLVESESFRAFAKNNRFVIPSLPLKYLLQTFLRLRWVCTFDTPVEVGKYVLGSVMRDTFRSIQASGSGNDRQEQAPTNTAQKTDQQWFDRCDEADWKQNPLKSDFVARVVFSAPPTALCRALGLPANDSGMEELEIEDTPKLKGKKNKKKARKMKKQANKEETEEMQWKRVNSKAVWFGRLTSTQLVTPATNSEGGAVESKDADGSQEESKGKVSVSPISTPRQSSPVHSARSSYIKIEGSSATDVNLGETLRPTAHALKGGGSTGRKSLFTKPSWVDADQGESSTTEPRAADNKPLKVKKPSENLTWTITFDVRNAYDVLKALENVVPGLVFIPIPRLPKGVRGVVAATPTPSAKGYDSDTPTNDKSLSASACAARFIEITGVGCSLGGSEEAGKKKGKKQGVTDGGARELSGLLRGVLLTPADPSLARGVAHVKEAVSEGESQASEQKAGAAAPAPAPKKSSSKRRKNRKKGGATPTPTNASHAGGKEQADDSKTFDLRTWALPDSWDARLEGENWKEVLDVAGSFFEGRDALTVRPLSERLWGAGLVTTNIKGESLDYANWHLTQFAETRVSQLGEFITQRSQTAAESFQFPGSPERNSSAAADVYVQPLVEAPLEEKSHREWETNLHDMDVKVSEDSAYRLRDPNPLFSFVASGCGSR